MFCVFRFTQQWAIRREIKQYYEIVDLFEDNEVSEYTLNLASGSLEYKLFGDDDTTYKYTVPNVSMFVDDIHDSVVEYNKQNPDNQIKMDYKSGNSGSWLISLLPTVVIMIVLTVIMLLMFRKMNQSFQNENNRTLSFGKARVKDANDGKQKKNLLMM